MSKTLYSLVAITAVIAIAVAACLSYRNKQMDRLYAQAAGYPQFFNGSSQSRDAVRRLAAYRGQRATGLLLDVALRHGPLILEDTQSEALKQLAMRHSDPEIGIEVANLLQPHEGLDTRRAAAVALESLPCNGECITSVLHYLERVWRGDPNFEDRTQRPPSLQDVTTGLRKDQQAVYESLHSTLRREKLQTLNILARVYGLGSDAPSPFALDIVSRLGLHEACPYLLQTDQNLTNLPPDSFVAPRHELQVAVASLGCK